MIETPIFEKLTQSLELKVEGLSLWMNRGSHLDVLFPDDRLGLAYDHHFVTLHTKAEPAPIPGAPQQGVPLDGFTLDFTNLRVMSAPEISQVPYGMLPLKVEANSVASQPDAVLKGTGLIAGLRLPPGRLTSLGGVRGPFIFGSDTDVYLGFGIRWSATVIGMGKIKPKVVRYGSSEVGEFDLFPDNQLLADRKLTIRSLSYEDRVGTDSIQYGEPLKEVAYQGHIMCADGKPLADVPYYLSKDPAPPGMMFPRSRLQKPCPPGFGI